MDMLDNTQNRLKLEYRGTHAWGDAQLRRWRETVEHAMDFGPDRQFWYGMQAMIPGDPASIRACAPLGPMCAAGMPMLTESRTTGASVQLDIARQDDALWRVGAETLRYRLNDWWPPSGGMMWPGMFWNIHDGRRDRASVFAEWEQAWTPAWMTLLGMRYTRVASDAGGVQGYDPDPAPPGSWGMIQADAAIFNARKRSRTDHALDVTAMVRHEVSEGLAMELGYAHKVRMPSLYERYTWSAWSMAAVMNNLTGDGNGYVGSVHLQPERAHTLSATVDWRGPDESWQVRLTPYLTRVRDYVDAVTVGTHQPDAFNVHRYANTLPSCTASMPRPNGRLRKVPGAIWHSWRWSTMCTAAVAIPARRCTT